MGFVCRFFEFPLGEKDVVQQDGWWMMFTKDGKVVAKSATFAK